MNIHFINVCFFQSELTLTESLRFWSDLHRPVIQPTLQDINNNATLLTRTVSLGVGDGLNNMSSNIRLRLLHYQQYERQQCEKHISALKRLLLEMTLQLLEY